MEGYRRQDELDFRKSETFPSLAVESPNFTSRRKNAWHEVDKLGLLVRINID